MKTKKFIIKNIVAVAGIGAAAVTFAGCAGKEAAPTTEAGSTTVSSSETEAKKKIKVEVVNSKGETKTYEEDTTAENLREVMDELKADGDFSYDGSESGLGIFIEVVNGEKAIYGEDGAYWALYVNDEYATAGADSLTVKDGETYKIVYEKAKAE